MNRRIGTASVLVLLMCLMISSYFIFTWSSINDHSNLFTVTGTLETGVEAGCVILRSDDGTQYLLLGWSNYPRAGTRVTVTGYFDNGIASYCMQGEAAIRVVSISTLEPITTNSGILITTSGYVYMVVENPQCYPQCLAPSFILTYLYVPPGTDCTGSMACYPPARYYRLLNADGNPFWTTAPNGTYVVSVTGKLATPSSWNCNSFYVPKICMSGDIYVENLTIPEFPNSILTLISLMLALAVVKFSKR